MLFLVTIAFKELSYQIFACADGVLAPGLCTLDGSARPSMNTSENLPNFWLTNLFISRAAIRGYNSLKRVIFSNFCSRGWGSSVPVCACLMGPDVPP